MWYLYMVSLCVVNQAAVYKAKDLVLAHQEYQRGLHMFEDWLEQEQGTLGSLSHPEGDVDTHENTLQQIQVSTVQPTICLVWYGSVLSGILGTLT